jgi:hypothetical protein
MIHFTNLFYAQKEAEMVKHKKVGGGKEASKQGHKPDPDVSGSVPSGKKKTATGTRKSNPAQAE